MANDHGTENRRGDAVTNSFSSLADVVDRYGFDPFLDAPTEFHDVLSSPLRKRVLDELVRAEDTLSVQELAERIAEAERVDIAKQGEALVRLHHVHLPKLRSHDLVTIYTEQDRRLIELTLGSD
ncbi:hypothetical protein ACFQL3_14275 [Natronoarchaeum sp. GCM10025321]|uniref:DUF7344 domain-containing protein n=1 Tax=Natronoarchaeum sp. GCM10025321 TaxID=3252684 RepID=UPI003610043A